MRFQLGYLNSEEVVDLISIGKDSVLDLTQASISKPLKMLSLDKESPIMKALMKQGLRFTPDSGYVPPKTRLNAYSGDFNADIIIFRLTFLNGDPDGFTIYLENRSISTNTTVSNKKLSNLAEKGRELLSSDDLADHYQKIARMILTEIPFVHIGYLHDCIVYDNTRIKTNQNTYFNTDLIHEAFSLK